MGFIRRWSRRLRWVRRALVLASIAASVNTALKRRQQGGTDFGPSGSGGAGVPAPTGGPTPQPPLAMAAAVPAPAVATDATATTAAPPAAWIAAEGDAPPEGYPVKANLDSGIFHVPGGLSYERTHADRWYRTPDAARADGLRQAKR